VKLSSIVISTEIQKSRQCSARTEFGLRTKEEDQHHSVLVEFSHPQRDTLGLSYVIFIRCSSDEHKHLRITSSFEFGEANKMRNYVLEVRTNFVLTKNARKWPTPSQAEARMRMETPERRTWAGLDLSVSRACPSAAEALGRGQR